MAGRGPAPKTTRRNAADKPTRGEITPAVGAGWQHGPTPEPPEGLKPASIAAWTTWMTSWVAAHWTPLDIPGLITLVLTFDQVQRGEFQRGPELRLLMDTYGITPKGQQDRRWTQPKADEATPPTGTEAPKTLADDPRFAHLRAV